MLTQVLDKEIVLGMHGEEHMKFLVQDQKLTLLEMHVHGILITKVQETTHMEQHQNLEQ